MKLDLARTAWRYELGHVSEQEAGAMVEAEVNRLIEEVGAHSRLTMGLIHRPSELIRTCDEGINAARGHKTRKQFTKAVVEIKKVRDAIAGLQRFNTAREEYESSRAAYRRIELLLESEYLLQSRSIRLLSGLLSDVEEVLKTAEHRQAHVIARICRQRSLALESVEPQRNPRSRDLLKRVEWISEICDRSKLFIVASSSAIEQACEALRSIIEQGYLTLSQRLIEDIEIDLWPRQMLVAEYERHVQMFSLQGADQVILTERLKSMVDQTSWIVATDFLLEKGLTALSANVERLEKHIARVHSPRDPPISFEVDSLERAATPNHHAGGVE